MCYVDEVRLRQIFIALLSNACKYADPGLLRMRCSARRSDIIITVEDEGPGIADEECTAIFEAFFRSHTSGKKEINGSGLGLAVVNAIALAHGGQATYRHSELGGTCIEISLPNCVNATL
ncbi:sensor histidine kinase [Serratia marcescens]|uniref:sensor histidine kinase n=1 Tax=Serratia marcescens TaxID=615 RepID=UPI001F14ACD6